MNFFPERGVKVKGTPLQLKKAALEIIGKEQVEGVLIADIDPNGNVIPKIEEIHEADFVCIAGGLYPLAELAAIAGCPFQYIPELGGHVPHHSKKMETPLDGLFVAGNITGIESRKIAMAQGTVAGLSITSQSGKGDSNIDQHLEQAMQNVETVRQHAAIQFNPEIESGRRKMYELWEKLYGEKQSPLKKIG